MIKKSSGKKSSIHLKDFTDLDFFSFSLANACLPCQLNKAYAVFLASNSFVGLETPKHNDFGQFSKSKFHFEHFPRNTQFISFDGPSNYLHLFKNHR